MNARPALLLVDLQRDYLRAAALYPPAESVVHHAAALLTAFRAKGLPVLHTHTLVRPDGVDRMPHWRRRDHWACIKGTAGALPPPAVAPRDGEPVFAKPFYSAFGCPDFETTLRELNVNTLVLAGVHTHGCVRASALDAYQAGFAVWVADDAVGSYDPLHAAATRHHLQDRACRFLDVATILRETGLPQPPCDAEETASHTPLLPVGWIDGRWAPGEHHHETVTRRNPADRSQCLARVPMGGEADVARAIAAVSAQQSAWAARSAEDRAKTLHAWAEAIACRRDEIIDLLMCEAGKPQREAAAEVDYALALLSATVRSLASKPMQPIADGVWTRSCPLGVVGVITPWNNPLALPVGKLAPALAWGNTVVWKPAIEAPRVAMLLIDTLVNVTGLANLVNLIFGQAAPAQAMIADQRVDAITFTGSLAVGRQVAASCAVHSKPLQAELGGNNAALITPHCDINAVARDLVEAAFSFAGQRCTAIRRVMVHQSIAQPFADAFAALVRKLPVGDPANPATRVGPLATRASQQRIAAIVDAAIARGATLLSGGRIPAHLAHGNWFEPTILQSPNHDDPVVQEESFGPIVVLNEAKDFDDGIRQLNNVKQGLLAALYSDNAHEQQAFQNAAQAGILRINAIGQRIHEQAPFGGWKASGLGPPEHGPWDQAFYSRPQAIYGKPRP
ncbi:aldehyde dehydrogenase family protein [Phycisphaerales bacterium AB-hyl4]|uniref:Aldehyde dehydrogenase family protein n=1 Tax=Natronomicrosphaera hydrolytica TaxID=3242702 RepID=A0ABV4U9Q7_9BACT